MLNQNQTNDENNAIQDNECNVKQDNEKCSGVKFPLVVLTVKKSTNTDSLNEEKEIFTEYLAKNNLVKESDFAEEIENLKLSNNRNFLKIAKVIITYKSKYTFNVNWKFMYQHLLNEVKIKRTQADKYVAVYNYCYKKFERNQLTKNTLNLGIEKLNLVTMLEDETNQEKLEEFITIKKLNVKELGDLIKIQNNTSKALILSEEFNKFKERV